MKSRLITQQAVEIILTDFEARTLLDTLNLIETHAPYTIIDQLRIYLKTGVEQLEETP